MAQHDEIQERAYHLWEKAGRPHGRHDEFWHQANEEAKAAAAKHGGAHGAHKAEHAPAPARTDQPTHAPAKAKPAVAAAVRPAEAEPAPATGKKPARAGKGEEAKPAAMEAKAAQPEPKKPAEPKKTEPAAKKGRTGTKRG